MHLLQRIGIALAALLVASCATKPSLPVPKASQFFRAYSLSDFGPQLRSKVADAERRFGVVAAPAEITPPDFRERPRPFSFEIRRAKKKVWITVFVLINERGETVSCEIVDATDAEVAREAGPIMCAATYRPASIAGKPVSSAFTFTSTGEFIPIAR